MNNEKIYEKTKTTAIRIDKDLWRKFKTACSEKDLKISHRLAQLIKEDLGE